MDFTTNNLHHANLFEGSVETLDALLQAVRNTADEVVSNVFETFGVDDARALIHGAQLKSLNERKLFFLFAGAITAEAQNALLKLFEEPPSSTHFFFVVPSADILLPTLRSRMELVTAPMRMAPPSGIDIVAFLETAQAKRIEILVPIIKEKNLTHALNFLNDLEATLAPRAQESNIAQALRHIFSVRNALQRKGASLKILLESVALSV